MDLIYTNALRQDVGILTRYTLDQEASSKSDSNTFEITTGTGFNNLELGSYIYSNGTELGGRVTGIKINTSQKKVVYSGITWRGLLSQHIVSPPSGSAYKVVNGQLENIIYNLIVVAGITTLFTCNRNQTISISDTKIDRYADLYNAIVKLLGKNDYRLKLTVKNCLCTLAAVPITDYSNENELSSDSFDFTYETQKYTVNHLIGLGQGELAQRQIVHKYIGSDGSITNTQYYRGFNEVAEVYDYPNVESLEELERATEEELRSRYISDSLKITANNIEAEIGDKFTAIDLGSGITVSQYVTGKITVIQNDLAQYQYKVGDKAI